MTRDEFIEYVGAIARRDWLERHLVLPCIVVAQAMKEGNIGNSELAVNANALFGIKLNGWTGNSYRKKADEQNPDGSMRTDTDCLWRAYDNWEQSILDHNDYIATRKVGSQKEPNFKEVVGETDVRKAIAGLVGDNVRPNALKYCTDTALYNAVKAGKTVYSYATGHEYAQSLLSDYIVKYDLTRFDKEESEKKLIINVHAGHNPDGKTACGAVGLIKESTEARAVKDLVISMLKADGHTVYDCTVDNGTSQNDVLKKIVAKCNAHKADLDVSIHFNSKEKKDYVGDGQLCGTEVYIYKTTSGAKPYAVNVVKQIAKLGYPIRDDEIKDSVKTSSLYVLKNTNAPAMLIECCFVNDKDDINLYNPITMATAIVNGILGKTVETPVVETPKSETTQTTSTLKKGAKGDAVKELQTNLNKCGYNLVVDGSFGNATDTALRDWQKKNGLVADGSYGPKSQAKMQEILSNVKYYPKYTGSSTSITVALSAVGEKDTSITHRKVIGTANGINNVGSLAGNTAMLNLLKQGKLLKA